MSLADLLYRCPRCGRDPVEGRGDTLLCRGCATSFRRRGSLIVAEAAAGIGGRPTGGAPPARVVGTSPPPPVPDAWTAGVAPHRMVQAVEEHGGPLSAARGSDGVLGYSAPALHHGVLSQHPVRRGRRLLGYMEQAGEGRAGLLRVTAEELSFGPQGEGPSWRRPLDDVVAVQLASRAIQVGFRGEGTLQWTLLGDSPYRWETLLQALLRRRWKALGRGEIVEFQPRVVAG